MFYHLFDWITDHWTKSVFPGSVLLKSISFRVIISLILSLIITTVYGKKLIGFLQRKQLGETVRDLGLAGEQQKKGTPTMGGIILILAILLPTILFGNLDKVYIRLMVVCTIWLGGIGFIDDYLKIRSRRIAKEKGVDYKKFYRETHQYLGACNPRQKRPLRRIVSADCQARIRKSPRQWRG